MNLAYDEQLIPQVFLFVDRKCFADWSIRKAKIDFHDLTFVISGKACYYINEEEVIVEAGDYINEHYSDNITVGILAEQANLNTVYFGKLFKETNDSTCKECLNRIRINNAEMMLSSVRKK
ncbi:hypothetical protein GMA19_01662 [Paenibacillus polymyxa E681]|uniref:AraC family transcriptional regulator n=1 Tax=Paenibacillus polymyxa TaxID=1406 RepID=UPI0001E31137|nr:AraC family transcriptional regulator [Paenibacillus polymyxa]ADM69484.1 hypothetical protein PPE_01647 [Paenibacillus polymyxa E681]QNV56499.1 hypothetical protein GE561_01662 [Paenibacillus polymyxa E681]QNV61336.1 hypothetical protein GMA19_01662 [Paenibacillus polymyxa E681]